MNFIITGPNVKILARTVNFFSKIGTEVQLEALPTGLCMKTINSTHTAYVMANFHTSFFISFQRGANDRFEENNCRVSIKPLLRIFKSLSKILRGKIWLQLDRMKIIFQFKCKSEILKTHFITLLEHEHVNALRLPQEFPNKIIGDHKVFSRVLKHLHHSVDEITFNAEAEQVVVSNYIETTKERTTMKSTLTVESTAFRFYQLDSPASVTFCYKEFKAMAYFAGHNKMVVEMNFDQAGMPIMIRMKKEGVVSLNFIIGTMRPRLAKENRSIQRANRKLMDNSKNKQTTSVRQADSERIDTCNSSFSQVSNPSQLLDSSARHSRFRDQDSSAAAQRLGTPNSMINAPIPNARRSEFPRPPPAPRFSALHSPAPAPSTRISKPHPVPLADSDSFDVVFAGNTDDPNSESQNAVMTPVAVPPRKRPGSPSVSGRESGDKRPHVAAAAAQLDSEALFSDMNVAVAVAESVPESPEVVAQRREKQEKIRRVLGKCFETTFDPRQMVSSSQVFAEDSDPDDK